MASEFHTTRRVEFAETDMAGIIHFANYFRYMEETEHAFFRSIGMSVMAERDEHHVTWPRVSASCDFLAPVRFEDVLDVKLLVSKKGKSSLTLEIIFSNRNTEVARGRLVTVCCEFKDGHLAAIPIPDWISHKIEAATSSRGA